VLASLVLTVAGSRLWCCLKRAQGDSSVAHRRRVPLRLCEGDGLLILLPVFMPCHGFITAALLVFEGSARIRLHAARASGVSLLSLITPFCVKSFLLRGQRVV